MENEVNTPETAPEELVLPPIGGEDADALPESGQTSGQALLEVVEVPAPERPFFTTPFEDYTVTEGLLALVFFLLLTDAFSKIIGRWF